MKAYAEVGSLGAPDLLARAQSGEREAFAALVERHHQDLVRIAYAITGDIDAARDAGQTAWIKAWQRLPQVREPERLRSWLIAIVANEARQRVRADRRRRVREIVPLVAGEENMSPTTLSSAERMDLAHVLAGLSPDDRQLLAMRYLAGLTAEEIGHALGLSGSGVRTRLSRLIAQLREELGNE